MFEFVFYCILILMGIAAIAIAIRKFVPSFTVRVPSLNGRVTQWTGGVSRFMTGPNHKTARAVTLYLLGLIVLLVLIAKLLPSVWEAWMTNLGTFVCGVLAIAIAVILPYVHKHKTDFRTWMIGLLLLLGAIALIVSGKIIQQIVDAWETKVEPKIDAIIPNKPNRSFTSDEIAGTYTIYPNAVTDMQTPTEGDSYVLKSVQGNVMVSRTGQQPFLLTQGEEAVFGPLDKIGVYPEDAQRGTAKVWIRSYE